MKSIKIFFLSFLILAVISGCGSKTVGMDFSVSDIKSLEVHHMFFADMGIEESVYEKKIITDSEDIESIYSYLQGLQVGKDVSREKPTYDNEVLTFRFFLEGGTTYVLIYERWLQGGGFVRTSSLFHNVTNDDALPGLWGELDYDVESSSEAEILFTE
jgi:hypothetical protein